MESRNLVRTLQTMEEAGLIRREALRNDKRVVRIHLTDKGRADAQREPRHRGEVQPRRAGRFTDKQLDNFRQVMSELDAAFLNGNNSSEMPIARRDQARQGVPLCALRA
ncbi:MAG: winged helix DNA-binding protein [Flavobacteriales bacterium]